MATQTPISGSRQDSVQSDLRLVIAKFSSVADTDTFATGLSVIRSCQVQSGANKQMGLTVSGGTVTFAVTSGPDTNTYLEATGY